MNLLQYLQQQGFSRRNILSSLQQGNILVNKKRADALKLPIFPGDEILYHNQPFFVKVTKEEKTLILFNKPKGYVVSKSDPHNKTIYEILPPECKNYYYIGRLDKESRGLLLLTNDPALVHAYEHPKFWIEKEYLIQLSSPLKKEAIQQAKIWILEQGELLKFKDIVSTSLQYQYRITLNEWKKRHIRRVIKSLWYELLDLQRIKEGNYTLWTLKEGTWQKRKVKNSGDNGLFGIK